jgi:hypothetical protein
VSNHWHWHEHVPRLNDSRFVWVLRNKWLFDRFFRSHGAPLPRTFGLFHPQVGHTPEGAPFTDISMLADALRTSPTGIVAKPVDGVQGAGVLVLTAVRGDAGNPTFETADKRLLSGRRLLERAFSTESAPPLIVQERVENHPDVARISPGATSTVRILTLRTPDHEVLIPMAAARFGRVGSAIDNYSQGGVLAEVNPATGRMAAGRLAERGFWRWSSVHPDSEKPIEGVAIPEWQKATDLVRVLSGHLPELRAVGWDILFGRDGPLILEGNHDWGILGLQSLGQGYLARPGVRPTLQAYGIPLP